MLRGNISVEELFQLGDDEFAEYHETTFIEYKEQFNFDGLGEYLRDFAGFVNNEGGHLIFGVVNGTWVRIGLNGKSIDMFNKFDSELITGEIIKIFDKEIKWEYGTLPFDGKVFGYFSVLSANLKPVIAKVDAGKHEEIKRGDIYYRYTGATTRIAPGDLERIIQGRIQQNNQDWQELMTRIATVGPSNAVVLDTNDGVFKHHGETVQIDKDLLDQLEIVEESDLSLESSKGKLILTGNILPVEKWAVKTVSLYETYPISYKEMVAELRKRCPGILTTDINRIINRYKIKENKEFSGYVFSSGKRREEHLNSGSRKGIVSSLYNEKALNFIADKYNLQKK